jgi:hypothetical protein
MKTFKKKIAEIKRNQDDIDSMTSDDGSNTSGKLVESSVSHSSTVGAGLFSKGKDN